MSATAVIGWSLLSAHLGWLYVEFREHTDTQPVLRADRPPAVLVGSRVATRRGGGSSTTLAIAMQIPNATIVFGISAALCLLFFTLLALVVESPSSLSSSAGEDPGLLLVVTMLASCMTSWLDLALAAVARRQLTPLRSAIAGGAFGILSVIAGLSVNPGVLHLGGIVLVILWFMVAAPVVAFLAYLPFRTLKSDG